MTKLWGGRFAEEPDELVFRFNASISFDRRLFKQDIEASRAWATALSGAGLLTNDQADTLHDGLQRILQEFESRTFRYLPADEDIHTAIERRLVELVGNLGARLHTGRSRNDQVATSFRLWCMQATQNLEAVVRALQAAMLGSAETGQEMLMPGYTHLQHAQPVTWAHWALSHFWPLQRDCQRLQQARERMATMPLGSAALAGTAYVIDRQRLARDLGFVRLSENSMDAVADRDFVADFLYATALLGVHVSRLAEQLILFSSREFSFVTLSDAYSTGSSLMPQKKNPDTLELARGKSARLIGSLVAVLTLLKGLPSTYDKDLQEDKEPVFDAFDTVMATVPIVAGAIATLRRHPEKMRQQLEAGLLATDLADYLVHKGVPFREAHHLVGLAVRHAEQSGRLLNELPLEALQQISPEFDGDVMECFDFERSVASRAVTGGTAPEAMKAQLAAAVRALGQASAKAAP